MKHVLVLLSIPMVIIFVASCGDDSDEKDQVTVETNAITSITATTATGGGEVTAEVDITARGVCWSSSSNPTVSDSKTTDGTGTGVFASAITGLSPATDYFVRAYATSASGTYYGSQVTFTTADTGGTVTDIDGNVYHTVTIGTQVWMVENLNVTRFRNGDAIPNITDGLAWADLTTPAYCNYANNSANASTYGRLYNWYAAADERHLAPTGWHVAANADWETLVTFLGGATVAGGKMKETGTVHWETPNTGATNESGFTALAGGMRYRGGSDNFSWLGTNGYWWSATEQDPTFAWYRYLRSNSTAINEYTSSYHKAYGFSVRCVKD